MARTIEAAPVEDQGTSAKHETLTGADTTDSRLEQNQREVSLGPGSQIIVERKSSEIDCKDLPDDLVAADLHNNDNMVLAALVQEGSSYSFRGLMRKLELHQQSLSRSLHRLEDMGLVERSPSGYRMSKAGYSFVSQNVQPPEKNLQGSKSYAALLQMHIPADAKMSELTYSLTGKWFKNLRWIGLIESEAGCLLQWASEDNSFQINLKVIADYAVIETNAASDREKMQAMIASYGIYEHITKIIQSKIAGMSYLTYSRYVYGADN